MEIFDWFLGVFQIIIGFNLVFPAILYFLWKFFKKRKISESSHLEVPDHALIVTAYKYTDTIPSVINSILKLNYQKFIIYVVADNCDVRELENEIKDSRVVLLRPPEVLESNTKSHNYAIENFLRPHNFLTIIDSDNLVDANFLNQVNLNIVAGYNCVQGRRAAKNLDNTFSCLDAARDIYYHFYDGKILFEVGSSATLAGSGMTFSTDLYKNFLKQNVVIGAGFDKVLQSWLINGGETIAFNESAIVYDEKTSKSDQLVKQRSRWINTWFKYSKLGFGIVISGIMKFDRNRFLFGLVLLRPPLFLFLFLSVFCLALNVLFGHIYESYAWLISFFVFIVFFAISLLSSNTDRRIYKSLINIPIFIFYQFLALLKSKKANEISVATQHFHTRKRESGDEN